MGEKCFLSIDWDFFIEVHRARNHSYRETMQDILVKWYREYLMGIEQHFKLEDDFELGPIYSTFLSKVLPTLKVEEACRLVLTESHGEAYEEVVKSGAKTVYLLDAHSDLGYGGEVALDYEVNCANWLGKLLKDNKIQSAFIVYSPYTKEHQEEFKEITSKYAATFISLETFLRQQQTFCNVHMCRSGPWTPPWYDHAFYRLAQALALPIEDRTGGRRDWHPLELSLAERINYKLGVI